MQARLITDDDDLLAAAEVMLQLRPQYQSFDALAAQMRHQQGQGYMLACVEDEVSPGQNRIVCVAGFVFNEKLAWGRSLYVDDLITDDRYRSRGAGKAMIGWLREYAIAQDCRELHLGSGIQRKEAHRFYDREGFDRASFHFSINDLSS